MDNKSRGLLVICFFVLFCFAFVGLFEIQRYESEAQPIICTNCGPLATPDPAPANFPTVAPVPSQKDPIIRIGSAWDYVLSYSGQDKGQTPVFTTSHKWIVHWQCYLANGAGKFPVSVYRSNGKAEQPANIWDCKAGHTSGNSPVYSAGDYFVGIAPAKKNAHYDIFIEVYNK